MLLRFLLALILLLALPTSAFAYSYGDPNKEEIAEAFKEIAAKLEKNPADWDGAMQAFTSKKKEIALEFGAQVAQMLEANFNQRQKELVLHNYKAVLVLNMDRRLNNAENQFSDYAKAKLLLAKARGTFTVLSPYVEDGTSKKVFGAFDKALTSLGNPGLFGVGTVPANKNDFLVQSKLITSSLNPLFPLKKAEATKPSTNGQTGSTKGGPAAKPAIPASGKPAASNSPVQSPTPATANIQSSTKNGQTQSTVQNGTAAANSSTIASGTQPVAATASGITPASSATSGAAVPSSAQSPAGSAQSTSSGQNADSAQTPASNQTTDSSQSTGTNSSAHSHESASSDLSSGSKVNPLITVSVITGLIVVVGAAFWIAKRNKLI